MGVVVSGLVNHDTGIGTGGAAVHISNNAQGCLGLQLHNTGGLDIVVIGELLAHIVANQLVLAGPGFYEGIGLLGAFGDEFQDTISNSSGGAANQHRAGQRKSKKFLHDSCLLFGLVNPYKI